MASRTKKPPTTDLPKFDAKKTAREQIRAAFDATYDVTDAEIDAQRYGGNLAKARDAAVGEKRGRAVAAMRTAAVLDAWGKTPSGGLEPYAVGGVTIQELRPLLDDAGHVVGVEVFLAGGFGADGKALPLPDDVEAHYRIVNPPTLVKDDAGAVDVGRRRYREDPLGAIAQAIGGARTGKVKR
jgi:hypothetical protein